MALAEQAGLSELISAKVAFTKTRVKSARVNPAGKLSSIIAGMAAGADFIDDLGVLHAGGISRLFCGVYAPAALHGQPSPGRPGSKPTLPTEMRRAGFVLILTGPHLPPIPREPGIVNAHLTTMNLFE